MVDISRSKAGPYIILKTLGEGGFGKVKKAVHEKDKKQVAIKLLNPTVSKDDIQLEVLAMKRLNHQNLINIIEYHEKLLYIKKDGRIFERTAIVMELAEKGSLFEFLKVSAINFGRGFREAIARTYFKQLIEALEYCHKQGIAHRDIKPDNILLDAGYNLKLGDFGWAGSARRTLKTDAGTRSYQAPEILEGKTYLGPPADIFSAGIVLFILLSGHPGFKTAVPKDPWYNFIYKRTPEKFWDIHEKKKTKEKGKLKFYSDEFKDLVNGLLDPDPEKRLTIPQIVEHKWFKEESATYEEIAKEFKDFRELITKTLQKEKPKAEEKKTEEGDNSTNKSGFQGYTPYRDGENEVDLDKKLAEISVPLDFTRKRELFEFTDEEEGPPASTIYSAMPPELLFKKLVLLASQYMSRGLKLSDTKYKFKFEVPGEGEAGDLQVKILLYKYEDSIAACFTKNQGDKMKFLDFIQEKFQKPLDASL